MITDVKRCLNLTSALDYKAFAADWFEDEVIVMQRRML